MWKPDTDNQTLPRGEPLIEGHKKNTIFRAILKYYWEKIVKWKK